MVRSKSEVIVANLLHSFNLMYAYEQPFTGRAGSVRYPDFTIGGAASGRRIFLEHLGMMSEPAYRESWQAKLAWYRSNGVMPIEEGEGDAGILITTSEDEGINSEAIEGQIRSFLVSELATIKRADIDGNDRIANLSGELTELRAEVTRLRVERLDRASEDVAETSRHSSDPLSPRPG